MVVILAFEVAVAVAVVAIIGVVQLTSSAVRILFLFITRNFESNQNCGFTQNATKTNQKQKCKL